MNNGWTNRMPTNFEGLYYYLEHADRELRTEIVKSGEEKILTGSELAAAQDQLRNYQILVTNLLNNGQFKEALPVIRKLDDLCQYFVISVDPDQALDIDEVARKCWTQINGESLDSEARPLRGRSIIDFAERQIDESQNLLGNRWLSRLCGGFIVAPSGHGKSSLIIQATICWSCGRVAFGIKPSRPLRFLIVQSEDDDNDVTEMAQMCQRLELTAAEKELVRKNTHIEWVNDVTGTKFLILLDSFLTQFGTDIVSINPYTAFQGGNIQDDELNNKFLRVELSRLLSKHQCGALAVHHTPKTNFQNTDKYSWFDWMYTMAGGSALTNWARSILVIAPTDLPGTYRFIAAKRFEKIGWQEREYWYAHSIEDGKILWVPASQDQIASGRQAKNATPQELLTLVPLLDPVPMATLIVQGKQKFKLGEKKVRHFLKVLLEDGKAFEHSFPRPNTNAEKRYARTSQI